MKQHFILYFILVALTLFVSCKNEKKFNKNEWVTKNDIGVYEYRNDMVKDLILNHKLKDLTYKQLVEKLGSPRQIIDEEPSTIAYDIKTKYGSNIDSKPWIILQFKFNEDSIVDSFKLIDTQD